MFIRPRILSIFTTRRCTAACDHCCVGAGPNAAHGTITVERMHALIDEATRVGTIQRVAFTGGEAFLLGRRLDELVMHAHDAGFATRVITNAYWAVNAKAAHARLSSLRHVGLDEIMFSTGTFHQAYVPVERVVLAAHAAAEHGIPARIAVEDCDQSRFDATMLYEQLAPELASGMLWIAHDAWTVDAGGRGSSELTHDARRERGDVDLGQGCFAILRTVSVTANLQLIACCGHPLEELPGLRIGSVAVDPLDAVLANAPDDMLKIFLHVLGPTGIAEFVARYEPGYMLPGSPATICDACRLLQRDERAMAVAAQHAAEIAPEIIARYVAAQSARLPEPAIPQA